MDNKEGNLGRLQDDQEWEKAHGLRSISKPVPIFVQVAHQLINAIQSGQFKVGSLLPSEQTLASTFGVSRPSIREALSCLQFEGYIAPRRGSGTIVVSTKERGRLATTENKSNKKIKYLDILEARLHIEPIVVGLAATEPDPRELKNLQRSIEGMNLTLSESDLQPHTDLAVHTALVRVCPNKVLARTAEKLLTLGNDDIYHAVRDKTWNENILPTEWLSHHEIIARAVIEHDSAKAVYTCRCHLISVLENIQKALDLKDGDQERISRILDNQQ